MQCVYFFAAADYGKLKKALEENPYSERSFAHVGYTLRESKGLGLEAGKYVLVFECEDGLARELSEKIKLIESAKELSGTEKAAALAKIKEEEDSAAAGFGSIFG